MSSEMQERIALTMAEKRREFIGRPLATIWPDLAIAAMKAMREPNTPMLAAAQKAWLNDPEKRTSTLWLAMLDAEIQAAEEDGDA